MPPVGEPLAGLLLQQLNLLGAAEYVRTPDSGELQPSCDEIEVFVF